MPSTPSTPFIPPQPGIGESSPRPTQRAPMIPEQNRNASNAVPWYAAAHPGQLHGHANANTNGPPFQYPGSYMMMPVGLPGVSPGPISGEGITQPGGFSEDWVGFGPIGGTPAPTPGYAQSSIPSPPPIARSQSYPSAGMPYPGSTWSAATTLPSGTPWSMPMGMGMGMGSMAPGTGYMGSMPLPGMSGMPPPPPPLLPHAYAQAYGMSPYAMPQQFGFGVAPAPLGPNGYSGTPWYMATPVPGFVRSPFATGVREMDTQQGEMGGIGASVVDDGRDPVTGAVRSRASSGSRVRGGDEAGIDSRWMCGVGYGPVLDRLQVAALNIHPQLNPLLTSSDSGDSHEFIKWNMLFPSSYAQRSDDDPRQSWFNGRHEPATFPRVTSLQLIFSSRRLPWMVTIVAADMSLGVTCEDVIDQLSDFLHENVAQEEFAKFPGEVQRQIGSAYHHHRSLSHTDDVPGEHMDTGLLRADFLARDSMFAGLSDDESLVRKRLEMHSKRGYSCVWVVNVGRRMDNDEELRVSREVRAREFERRRMGRSVSANASLGDERLEPVDASVGPNGRDANGIENTNASTMSRVDSDLA